MKIAIVYDPIYPYVIGGGEKRNREFAGHLVRRGHEVYLVGMKYWEGADERIEDGIRLYGVCKGIGLYDGSGRRSPFSALYFGIGVFRHLLRHSYDIVDCGNIPYIFILFAAAALRLSGRRKTTKLAITWHEVWGRKCWTEYSRRFGLVGTLIERYCARLADLNIANSPFTRERAIGILGMDPAAVEIVPNGIETKALAAVTADEPREQIVYVGRLIKHKCVDMLIDAFAELVKNRGASPALKLVIVGNGPEAGALKEHAAARGVGERVVFAGFLEAGALKTEIKRSRVFALPSEREGFAIVVIEAMALGVPVVARRAEFSAVKTIVTDGTDALLFDDLPGLVSALSKLLTDPAIHRRMVDAGYRTSARYDMETAVIPALEAYYARSTATVKAI